MENEFGKDRFKDVKPADALGKLAQRSQASRTTTVIIAVVVLFALVFAIGLVIRSVQKSGTNAPSVPNVDIR